MADNRCIRIYDLKQKIQYHPEVGTYVSEEDIDLAERVLTLEAKKPRLIGGRMMCPNCLRNERALHFYCDCCGQPIDWSDEVKAIFDEAGWDDE